MSRARGEAWVNGELVGYFVYDGTFDVAHTKITPTEDELVHTSYGRLDNSSTLATCTCVPKTETPALLYTTYGSGYHWKGTVCTKCLAITSETKINLVEDWIDGHPFKPPDD